MGHRYYDDTPARGSRKADPSIDAWFRELRGDAAPTGLRSAAAASRQRQRELEAEPGGWHRGSDGPRRAGPAPSSASTDSWTVDTRTWSPDWDTNATSYMPRPATSNPREGVPIVRPRDRRSTGDQPRIPDRRPTGDQPRIADHRPDPAPPGDRRPTGEQARIAEWRPAEPRAIEARAPEGRSAEIRDLNEAREMREARAARPARPAPAPAPPTPDRGHARDSYDTTYDDLMAQGGLPTPPPSPSRSRTPAAAIAPAAPARPAPPLPSPAPAYVPAPAAAAYAPSALGTPSYREATYSSAGAAAKSRRSHAAPTSFESSYAPTEYAPSLTPYTQGSLATAPAYAEPSYAEARKDTSSYPTPDEYTGTRLPEPRHADSQFDVVLPDSIGNPALAFKNGQWFRLSAGGLTSSPITVRSAVLDHADLAGSVVQIVCWWMRENARRERALDIATELALAVTELTHMAELRKKTPAVY